MYQDRTKGAKTNMNDNELKMESCSHVWVYDHTDHDTVYMRCPYCNMVRLAMPGEPCHIVNQELKIRHDGEEGDA